MSSKKRTGTQSERRAPSVGAPQWRPVRWQWRKPRLLEVVSSLTTLPVLVAMSGQVPEDASSLGVTGAVALHAVANLAARCIRRTRY
ncbi:hypothetical protein ACWD48_31965 [Streptomyces sp. NPDC002519]